MKGKGEMMILNFEKYLILSGSNYTDSIYTDIMSMASIPLTCVSVFAPDRCCSSLSEFCPITCAIIMLPVLFFFTQNCLTILGHLYFHVIFRMIFIFQ